MAAGRGWVIHTLQRNMRGDACIYIPMHIYIYVDACTHTACNNIIIINCGLFWASKFMNVQSSIDKQVLKRFDDPPCVHLILNVLEHFRTIHPCGNHSKVYSDFFLSCLFLLKNVSILTDKYK